MGYPDECKLCAGLANQKLNLLAKPYRGKNAYIMLVGRDPTVPRRKVEMVFQLDDKNNRYKHIHPDILNVINDDFYATNLVKCTFSQEPRRFCIDVYDKGDTKTVKTFLLPFFQNCRRYFSEEFDEIGPKILMSFGEIPHQLIVEGFKLADQRVHKEMKKAFSNIYRINLLGQEIFYIPCIREQGRKTHTFLQDKWPVFIERLKATVNSVMI